MSYSKMITCISVGLAMLAIPTSAMASLINTTHSNIRRPGVVKVQPKFTRGAPTAVINISHSNIRHPSIPNKQVLPLKH